MEEKHLNEYIFSHRFNIGIIFIFNNFTYFAFILYSNIKRMAGFDLHYNRSSHLNTNKVRFWHIRS